MLAAQVGKLILCSTLVYPITSYGLDVQHMGFLEELIISPEHGIAEMGMSDAPGAHPCILQVL